MRESASSLGSRDKGKPRNIDLAEPFGSLLHAAVVADEQHAVSDRGVLARPPQDYHHREALGVPKQLVEILRDDLRWDVVKILVIVWPRGANNIGGEAM